MKVGIMQPYFFPYIGYWQLMNEVDVYVIYDDVNFIKGGWINRNRILTNGKPSYFNVQMKGASPFKKINEVEVSDDPIFKRKLLSTLKMSYSRAPYFSQIYPIIENIINNEESNLAKYLEYSIRSIANYLDMNKGVIPSALIVSAQDNADIRFDKKNMRSIQFSKNCIFIKTSLGSVLFFPKTDELIAFFKRKPSDNVESNT